MPYPPLFKGSIPITTTQYVGVPIGDADIIELQIAWKDATSAAAVTFETSSFSAIEAPVDEAGAAWEWKDSGITITGPAASAAGSTVVHLGNIGSRRGRVKIVTTAATDIEIRSSRKYRA